MGLFKKKDRVIDLTKNYKKTQGAAEPISLPSDNSSSSSESTPTPFGGNFGIFGGATPSPTTESSSDSDNDYVDFSGSGAGGNEKKKRLAKRLMNMTDKLEDISNQIYHLQQRIEVIEKKMGVGGY